MTKHTADLGDAHGEWYWCLKHGTVEPKGGCPDKDRLGPYPTPEAARHWRDRVSERNEVWDAEDEAWEGGPDAT